MAAQVGATARRAHVAEVRGMGAGYAIVVLDDPAAPPARPGQFVMVHGAWGNAPLLPRPMSILAAGPRLELLVKVVGEGTRRLCEARPGEAVDVLGPLGTVFEDPAAGTRAVLIGGGVGVAPLWFLAEEWARRGGARPTLVYGGRTAQDLPGAERLAAITDLVVTTEDGSRGRCGRVTVALDELVRPGAMVYTCGPSPMMAAVARHAIAAGVPCTASLEAPMACGFGVCLGCAVPRVGGGFLYCCVQGPVVDAARIDWGA
jgi:dihydroorotate dehydrogenase electron transfer subunit